MKTNAMRNKVSEHPRTSIPHPAPFTIYLGFLYRVSLVHSKCHQLDDILDKLSGLSNRSDFSISTTHIVGNINGQHQNYPSKRMPLTKGRPGLIASIITMTINTDQQMENINVQLCWHFTPNAFFYIFVLQFFFCHVMSG